MPPSSRVLLVSFNVAGHDSLALGYVKAYALKDTTVSRRTHIEILNLSHEEGDVRQAMYYITEYQPQLIGLSCYCWNMQRMLELARCVKQILPRVPIVAGGPEIGPVADRYLEKTPELDVGVHDEGEAVFLELMQYYLGGKGTLDQISGISFRRDGTVVRNPDRPPIKDLDEIPSPYLTGILVPRDGVTYVQSFRGCPFRCGFCYEAGRHKGLRFFSHERVEAEVALIMDDSQIRSFHFVDSVFNLNTRHLKKMTQILRAHNRHQTRLRTIEVFAENLDEETVGYLVEAGVQSIETGPQTAVPETQERIGRYFDSEKFARAVRLMRDAGIEVWCDLIVGLPGDDFFLCAYSVAFIMKLKPAHIVMSILHVLPGTPLFEQAEAYGLSFDPEPPHYVMASDTFPFEQIYEAVLFSSAVTKEYNMAAS